MRVQEIAKTELANLTEQRLSLEAEITDLAAAAEQLQGLYGRQDQLLKVRVLRWILDGRSVTFTENIRGRVRLGGGEPPGGAAGPGGGAQEQDRGGKLQVEAGPAHGGLRLQAAQRGRGQVADSS